MHILLIFCFGFTLRIRATAMVLITRRTLHMPTGEYLCMPPSTPCMRISPENRARLNELKRHPKESYDTVIGRLLDRVTDPDLLTDEDRQAIAESLEEIRDGKYYTLKDAKNDLGLS